MKTSVSVIAIKPFEFKGTSYQPNQSLDLTPIDAVVLAKKHLITLTKRAKSKTVAAATPAPAPPAVAEPVVEEPKKKRTYRRRDLQAEQTTEIVPVAQEPEPEIATSDSYDTYRDFRQD